MTGFIVIKDANNLYRDLKHGKLRIYSGTDKFNIVASDEITKGYDQYLVDLSSHPENEQEIIRFRLMVIDPLSGPSARTRKDVEKRVAQINKTRITFLM